MHECVPACISVSVNVNVAVCCCAVSLHSQVHACVHIWTVACIRIPS